MFTSERPHYSVALFSSFMCTWNLKPSQEKLKTMVMQNFGGQIWCILGDVHVTNRLRLATQQLCTYTTLFCKFLCRFYTTTTWKCLIKISRLLEDVNKWHQFSFSLPVLWYSSLGFINFLPEKFAKNLTKWMTWNNGDEVCKISREEEGRAAHREFMFLLPL